MLVRTLIYKVVGQNILLGYQGVAMAMIGLFG